MTKGIIQKLKNLLWPHRHQFAKYVVIGLSGFVIDMGLLIVLSELFGISPTIALVITQIVVLGYNFSLNKFWTFKNREVPHKQFVRFLLLATFNYIFGIVVMYIFNEMLQQDYRLVRVATIAIMVSWNFLLYKYWVYK